MAASSFNKKFQFFNVQIWRQFPISHCLPAPPITRSQQYDLWWRRSVFVHCLFQSVTKHRHPRASADISLKIFSVLIFCQHSGEKSFWPVCFIKIRNLCVVSEKICQETGRKFEKRKSVQKSAKLVHLTNNIFGYSDFQI